MCDGAHEPHAAHDEQWRRLYKWNTFFTAVGALGGWLAIGIMVVALLLQ